MGKPTIFGAAKGEKIMKKKEKKPPLYDFNLNILDLELGRTISPNPMFRRCSF
jgi:hypothetical protein